MSHLGRVLILGLGASGEAAARYCAKRIGGDVSSVTVVDAADSAQLRTRAEQLEPLGVSVRLAAGDVDGEYDICIASPGIPPHDRLMVSARSAASRVVSEIEFAFERSASPWIAVTGTNGKTTTTALITHLLNCAAIPATAVGNIGTPAISVVEQASAAEMLVAEVSSFQLSLTERFRPRVAVLLNVTPDHLDWHGSLESYSADKAKIFANLTEDDTAVIDIDDPGSAPYAEQVAARGVTVVRVSRRAGDASVVDGALTIPNSAGSVRLIDVDDMRIRGEHNISNALAAAVAAHAVGASVEALRLGLETFEPIEHRLEPVGVVGGVEWFNDSKATNPDAVAKALSAFDGRPVVLLLGGRNKGNEFGSLAKLASGRVRAAIAFGEARGEIAEAFDAAGVRVESAEGLAEAVETAARIAETGDAVVLSPACASFDEFDSFGHRGRVFKQLVESLEEESS